MRQASSECVEHFFFSLRKNMAAHQVIVLRGLIVLLAVVSVTLLASHYVKSRKITDTFDNLETMFPSSTAEDTQQPPAVDDGAFDATPAPVGGWDDAYEPHRAVSYDSPPASDGGCFPRDRLTASDLLPKDAANTTWAQVAPAGQGDVSNRNFLTAGYQVGMASSILRNPNYGLRSEPPCPQSVVSPWGNTTIDPDLQRRPLEVEEAPQCA
jgi:hypothetical protein